ncbi:MAG: anhydro-N-acetylmuramic acid kinase [Spongiibacteraceae bacterium]
MNSGSGLYLGLMSGTSLDSIDAALVQLDDNHCQLIAATEHPIPTKLRQQLIELCQPGDNEIERMGLADRILGKEFAAAANSLLRTSNTPKERIIAIGSHGQTIRHRPSSDNAFTLQIGDPNTIAFETGITTVADFRRMDIAAGGQGAPLAPAFHQAAFAHPEQVRAIINIGGMANISLLNTDKPSLGFDTGPGNILMDSWIQQVQQQKYDQGGLWAASGRVYEPLLTQLLTHPFLQKTQPKSTGREEFNLQWLQLILNQHAVDAIDVQATLLEFTAQTICDAITKLSTPVDEVFICGGGAYNNTLMTRLSQLLQPLTVATTKDLGIAAEWIEAAAFAWLAQQTLAQKPGNLTAVTGADQAVILGAIYQA